MEYVVGIDEAGRGALVGPVAVGAVFVPRGFDWTRIPGVGDSKQLSEKQRNTVYRILRALVREGVLRYAVAFSSASTIDRYGIVCAVQRAVERAIGALGAAPRASHVLLDGGLRAPQRFISQETIIGGDAREPAIGLASIAAKVERDRLLVRLARKYPGYGLEVHKGYGTAAHRSAIAARGLSAIHRASFCTRLRVGEK